MRTRRAIFFAGADMDFEFNGQTALVTGASRGIGRAIARGLVLRRRRPAAAGARDFVLEFVDGLADQVRKFVHFGRSNA